MKIGIDLRSMEKGSSANHRGIGRYGTELIEALSHIDHSNEYVFFVSNPNALTPALKLNEKFKHAHAHGKKHGLRGVKYVRIVYLMPRSLVVDKYDLDVFLQLDVGQPITVGRTPVVKVLYDLIPFLYKSQYQHVHLGGYTPGHLIGYSRVKIQWKLLEKEVLKYKQATKIISISEHSKNDLLAYATGINASSITVTPLAAGGGMVTKSAMSARVKKLRGKDYLFYLGGVDPRKGLVNLVSEMENVWVMYPDTYLVLAGKEITDYKVPEAIKLKGAIAKSSRPNQILCFGFVPDPEMYWLYENAAAFVFPSRYEGFGLPVLEAMQAGAPVITYANSSIPEVAGNATMLIEDGQPLAPAITKLLGDIKLRKRLVALGKKQAARFTWEKTAKKTLTVLRSAAKEQR